MFLNIFWNKIKCFGILSGTFFKKQSNVPEHFCGTKLNVSELFLGTKLNVPEQIQICRNIFSGTKSISVSDHFSVIKSMF